MKLLWIKLAALLVLLGGSYAFYVFGGGREVTFEVPAPVGFEEIGGVPAPRPEAEDENRKSEDIGGANMPRLEEGSDPVPETSADSERGTGTPPISSDELPDEVNLAVPFTPQAPFANWDEVHEDTCEEASVLMVHAYYEGQAKGTIDPNVVEEVLLDMVETEKMMFGYFKDTTAAETAKFAKAYYGYERVDVIENPSVEDLKRHLAQGHPLIVPVAGRILANPFFSGAGPDYHMLVVKGYTKSGFITNDPGTRRGADWVYTFDHLMESIHDWVVPEGVERDRESIPDSARKVVVIYPN